ncbi:MAG: hypothetical protein ACREYE_12505, partial [Gammaproteobacteria bacterium]
RANRLPAGQIAVLSRTVLARILRLDRRTGISAKEDLTAPPQTSAERTRCIGWWWRARAMLFRQSVGRGFVIGYNRLVQCHRPKTR